MARPLNPPACDGPRGNELPAYVSNGLIGIRIREMPLMPGVTIVSGVAGEHPVRRVEAALPVPYPLAGDIAIDGVRLSDQPWTVTDLRQEYDFATAELTTRFVFVAGEVQADLEIVTFASRSSPALLLQEIAIRTNKACTVEVQANTATTGLRGRIVRRFTGTPGEDEPVVDGFILWETEGGISQCGIALHTELLGAQAERTVREWDETGPLETNYIYRSRSGHPVRLRQIAGMIPSIVHARPDEEAVRRVARGHKQGFEQLREANREAWKELWRSRIVIRGASERHQALIDAAFFYLNASIHRASPSSTSIFGLSMWHDYHYYYGHVMWDIDAFCVPPAILLQPGAARALLHFRTRATPSAHQYARLSGRDGLQFPWQSAPITTEEAAPGAGDAPAHEDHCSLHVARGFSLYADITGDQAYLAEDAWPVLCGVADWIVSRVERTSRGFEMLQVMGPAEVPNPPNNDAFTLMGSYDVLSRAIRAAERLGKEVPEMWRAVRDGLYLPHRSDGAIATHDDFRIDEDKGATPSPLAGFFPFDYPASEAERRATLELFLDRWPDYVGSPMLPALYTAWAAIAGDRVLALKLFEEGYAAYDHPRFHQCLEYRPDHPDSEVHAGPFFANLGGMLLTLLYGLCGLVIDDGDPAEWPRRPVVLPAGWESIEVERLWVRGREARLTARHGADRAELTLL